MRCRCIILLYAVAALAGCHEPTGPRTVQSRDLDVKIPAIKRAGETKDQAAVKQLVADLDSDDAAVRLFAIKGLEDITGETFGYVYYADFEQRRPAVQKWREWLKRQSP
jgi:HEAT repeat protein